MKLKTGIFGGSFNPVHIGHLALANYLCEFEGLDELWFMISPQNPFKQTEHLLDDASRLELVRLATKGYPKFHASDFEFSLPKPSYTIHTMEALRAAYPDREFYLIIGADNWAIFDRWKDSHRLVSENKILIYPRPGTNTNEALLPENASLLRTPLLEISSTFIRDAIREGKDIRYFLHPDVFEYIQKNRLYL